MAKNYEKLSRVLKRLISWSVNVTLSKTVQNPKTAFTVIKDKEKQHIVTFKH